MLNHYLPKHYLRGFTSPKQHDIIWVYSKSEDVPFPTKVKNVGAETGFYPPIVEEMLANEVEEPCRELLESVRRAEPFGRENKKTLSKYVLTMVRRVPRHRMRLYRNVIPESLEIVFGGYRQAVVDSLRQGRISQVVYDRRIAELDDLEFRWNEELPENLKPENLPPQISLQIVEQMESLNWVFLVAEGPSMFLTSDNPAFYTERIGMNKPRSELLLPLSSLIALWITGTPYESDCSYCSINEIAVHEVNKRIAQGATRFVYYHKQEQWVSKVTRRQKPRFRNLGPKQIALKPIDTSQE